MSKLQRIGRWSLAVSAGALLAAGWFTGAGGVRAQASAPVATPQVVAMRRLSESQYRNTIADIFGPDIRVAGRFEPVVRPVHELIASGARDASLSPAGLEQFDAMARNIAGQVFGEANRARFVPCVPASANAADEACAKATLAPIGRYLFRRPLSNAELGFYVRLADRAAAPTGSFHKGLELALAAMLDSPRFLYVTETAEPDPARPGHLRLDNWSRAARLSFMLWNSTPNETLLKAAAEGRLTDQKQLSDMAAHMVGSPRFEQGLRAFFADMLLFERFDDLSKDPIIYPYFNTEVAAALPEQMLRTVTDHLLTRNGDYRALFTTPRTFMTRPLGGLYGVPVAKPKGWEPFQFPAGDDRAGLLGQAGFLALYAHPGRSSPTLRGRAIRELLLCQPVPDPPGNVNFTAVQDVNNKAKPTARIRLETHISDPVCAGCHTVIDPVGLGLERFDGIGRWRATENEARIDASGQIDNLKFAGAPGLGQAISKMPEATQCVASRALEYARGWPAGEDGALVDALDRKFGASGYSIRALFQAVASLPEAYQPKGGIEVGNTHVTMAANPRQASR
jgi:hypothetical protein